MAGTPSAPVAWLTSQTGATDQQQRRWRTAKLIPAPIRGPSLGRGKGYVSEYPDETRGPLCRQTAMLVELTSAGFDLKYCAAILHGAGHRLIDTETVRKSYLDTIGELSRIVGEAVDHLGAEYMTRAERADRVFDDIAMPGRKPSRKTYASMAIVNDMLGLKPTSIRKFADRDAFGRALFPIFASMFFGAPSDDDTSVDHVEDVFSHLGDVSRQSIRDILDVGGLDLMRAMIEKAEPEDFHDTSNESRRKLKTIVDNLPSVYAGIAADAERTHGQSLVLFFSLILTLIMTGRTPQ